MPNPARCVIAALAECLLVAAAPSARAAESDHGCTGFIDSVPAVITTPGTWCLRQDLQNRAEDWYGVLVDTDDVVVDCRGYRLDGHLAAGLGSTSLGVFTFGDRPQDRTTVRRCTVVGYVNGIEILGNGNVIEDNRVIEAADGGISVWGEDGAVRRNHVLHTGGPRSLRNGIARAMSANGTFDITDNTIAGFIAGPEQYGFGGIMVWGGIGGSVQGNRIRMTYDVAPHTRVDGIQVINGRAVSVRNNIVVGEGDAVGIDCLYPTAQDNVAKDNLMAGVRTGSTCRDGGGNAFGP